MAQQGRRTQEHRDAFLALHAVGWTSAAIARVLGISTETARKWRSALGISSNCSKYSPKFDSTIALAMYEQGASDGEIAKHFGATQGGATRWRQRHSLERNYDPNPPLDPYIARSARRMLADGASKRQVADAHEIACLQTVQKIRRRMPRKGLRPTGMTNATIRAQVLRDKSIVSRITRAVGVQLPPDVKHDAVTSLYLAVLDGLLSRDLIEERAARFRTRAFALNGHDFSHRSLDDGEGRSWIDQLEDPNALDQFDEIAFRN